MTTEETLKRLYREHLMPGWIKEINQPSPMLKVGLLEELRLQTHRREIQGCWLLCKLQTAYTRRNHERH